MTLPSQGAGSVPRLLVSSLLLFAAMPRAQQVVEGLQQQATALPANASTVLVRPNGGIAWFDGDSLWHRDPGASPRRLLQLAPFTFGSFVIEVGPDELLFGENSTGHLWHVPVHGDSPTVLGQLPFNYDAVLLAPGRALVSARTGGFSAAWSELFVVDVATGAAWLLVSTPGPSGPIALAPNGDVYFATASLLFPTPPGLTSIVRFPRPAVDMAILRNRPLTMADAQNVWSGLDAASDLCFDDDGDLLFADWMNNTIGELNDATTASPSLAPPLVSYGLLPGAASLHFVPDPASNAVFEPFQPAAGVLHVHETDYFLSSTLRRLQSARPTLTAPAPAPVPTGSFVLHIANGPANGLGFVAIALVAAGGSGVPLAVPGFEQPLVWNLATATPLFVPITLDAQGAGTSMLTNPGFAPIVPATAQAALVSTIAVLASTTAATFLLGT